MHSFKLLEGIFFKFLKMMSLVAFTDSFVLVLWSYKYPRSCDLRDTSATGNAVVLPSTVYWMRVGVSPHL